MIRQISLEIEFCEKIEISNLVFTNNTRDRVNIINFVDEMLHFEFFLFLTKFAIVEKICYLQNCPFMAKFAISDNFFLFFDEIFSICDINLLFLTKYFLFVIIFFFFDEIFSISDKFFFFDEIFSICDNFFLF